MPCNVDKFEVARIETGGAQDSPQLGRHARWAFPMKKLPQLMPFRWLADLNKQLLKGEEGLSDCFTGPQASGKLT